MEDTDVYIADHSAYGTYFYVVIVNGQPYDTLRPTERLTWTEQCDIADGYREAFNEIGDLDV